MAKGSKVNLQDRNGMTPLMWTAYRCTNPEPSRLLLTLGASASMQDSVNGNTPAHWACISGNNAVVGLFVNKTPAGNFSLTNAKRETPLEILKRLNNEQQKDKKPPHGLMSKRIIDKMERATDAKTRGPLRILRNRNLILGLMYAAPTFIFYFIGSIFDLEADYLIKLGLFVLLYIGQAIVGEYVFDERMLGLLPISIYFATKFWFYVTWLTEVHQVSI